MTQARYLQDAYLKEFEATVVDIQDNKIMLDQTAFYPVGGGQPCDTGMLVNTAGITSKVILVEKKEQQIVHHIEGQHALKKGEKIRGIIDWDRRYRLMRMHTALHLLHAMVYQETQAPITGNELQLEKSRFDLDIEAIDKEKIISYIEKANEAIKKNVPVKVYTLAREEAWKIPGIVKLAQKLPPEEKELRIVEIEGIDIEADGGTHVKSLGEINTIQFLKAENRGKGRKRIYFTIS